MRPVRVAIYVRVSTVEQAEREYSLDAQIDRCRKLIALHETDGWIEHRIYNDAGWSGKSMERPSLRDLIADAEARQFDVIAIFKLDRLTRSMKDFHHIWERIDSLNISLVAASQEINTSTATGRMMVNMLMTFAEFERELISERTQAGMDQAFGAGDLARSMGGRAPFGYDYDKIERVFIINEREAPAVRDIFQLFNQGVGLSEIATRLNESGMRSRVRLESVRGGGKREVGGNEFTIQGIKNILANPVYVGKLERKGIIREGNHHAILSPEIRDKWPEIRERLLPTKTSQINVKTDEEKIRPEANKHGLLFKGLLFDADTGQALTPGPSGKPRPNQSEPHLYYVGAKDRKIKGRSAPSYPARKLENIALLVFENLAREPRVIENLLASDAVHVQSSVIRLESELKGIKAERDEIGLRLKNSVSASSKVDTSTNAAQAIKDIVAEFEEKDSVLKHRQGEIAGQLSTLRAKQLSEQSVSKALQDFRGVFQSLPKENRVQLCQLFFKRIEVRKLAPAEVASKSGGYVLSNGTVIFPVKRTEWVEMKFSVRANVDYQRLFNRDVQVRIGEMLASPTRFELVSTP